MTKEFLGKKKNSLPISIDKVKTGMVIKVNIPKDDGIGYYAREGLVYSVNENEVILLTKVIVFNKSEINYVQEFKDIVS